MANTDKPATWLARLDKARAARRQAKTPSATEQWRGLVSERLNDMDARIRQLESMVERLQRGRP